jgi:pimeloyl-ACP methyl ester carboxylesterase
VGHPDLINEVAFNDLDAEGQAEWSKEMTHTSARLFATPSGNEPWTKGVNCGYIFCTDDNALPYPLQQQMAAQLGPDANTVAIKAGHCPFLSIPDELVKAVDTIVSRWN